MVDPLDLSVFDRSVRALSRALELMNDESRVALLGPDGPDVVISHVIKSFELAYESGLKTMTRRLAADRPELDLATLTYNDRLRAAAESGLIADPAVWFGFRELRNRTVHTYNRDQALAVAAGASGFALAAGALLRELERRNG